MRTHKCIFLIKRMEINIPSFREISKSSFAPYSRILKMCFWAIPSSRGARGALEDGVAALYSLGSGSHPMLPAWGESRISLPPVGPASHRYREEEEASPLRIHRLREVYE